jgi:hypothetical protein
MAFSLKRQYQEFSFKIQIKRFFLLQQYQKTEKRDASCGIPERKKGAI